MVSTVNVELRVCDKTLGARWGFVADGYFYPIGVSKEDATNYSLLFHRGDPRWVGIPLNECGPNLDVQN